MKILIEKEQVIDGLQKAANILPQRTGAAYLRSIWIKTDGDSVSLLATDVNMEFHGKYPAIVEQEGLVGVQGRAFVDLIRQLPNGKIKLQLDTENQTLHIEQGRKKYKLPTNDAIWFQEFSPFPVENAVIWSGDFFQDLLEKVTFCISDDDAMDAIACLYMKPVTREGGDKYIEVCGLNGHQFALVSFHNDDLFALLPEDGILLQKKYLQELKKWLGDDEIEFNITDKRFYVRTLKGETLSLPRVTHNYPDYNAFLEKVRDSSHGLIIDRKECSDALGRLSIFNTKNIRFTNFELSEQEAILTVQGQDVGSATESLEVKYDGTIQKIAFPSKELMDIMGHFQSSELTMRLTSDEGPCAISGKDDVDYLIIIMPMKVGDTAYYSEDDV